MTLAHDHPLQMIGVVWIPVPDLDQARTYYSTTLGLGEPVYDLPEAGWIEFELGEGSPNLAVNLVGAGASVPSITPIFSVPNCELAVRALRKRGVDCEDPETFPGYVTVSTVTDPFGNRLQIMSDAPEG